MPVTNDIELADTVAIASEKLQEIQDYLGRRNVNPAGRVEFPRGYLRSAESFRAEFPFFSEYHVKANLAYACMLNDVYWWILHRTDLSNIARDMVVKAAIYNLASIAETMLKLYSMAKGYGRNVSFDRRCDRMADDDHMITDACRIELKWLWETRGNIHIYEMEETDYQRGYSLEEFERAMGAVSCLKDELVTHSRRTP